MFPDLFIYFPAKNKMRFCQSEVIHFQAPKNRLLTVTVRAGSRLPKSSKMLITVDMSTIAQK